MPDAADLIAFTLKRVLEQKQTLTRPEARALLDRILDGHTREMGEFGSELHVHALRIAELRMAALLGALAARGETTEELAGFVDCLRARSTRIPLSDPERALLIDTCGTGGDLSGTFNISTAAALVAAAAGDPGRMMLAKHGNRAVTSRCGSADVLEALGIPVDLTPAQAAASLRTHGFAFLPAPALQPAMRAVMPIRRALGVRTAFNILGPMTNPAGATAQVLGVYAPHLVPVVAHTLAALGTRHAFVVHGAVSADGGMDEFSLSGPTTVAEVRGSSIHFSTASPADFGLPSAPIEALAGGNAQTNADILRSIFAGTPSPCRDIVVMNAAAVLIAAGLAHNFLDGARLAADTIDIGKAAQLVTQLSAPQIFS